MGYRKAFGAVPSPVDIRDWRIVATAANYPESYIIPHLEYLPVLNQGDKPSCVAHALASILAWHHACETGTLEKMSIVGIFGNRNHTDYKGDGMICRDACLTIKADGDPLLSVLPGNLNTADAIKAYENARTDEAIMQDAKTHAVTGVALAQGNDAIKHALMNYGPIPFVTRWYSDFKFSNGYLTTSQPNEGGYHCMIIYGWGKGADGKEYWLIQNSWGKDWGERGRAKFPMELPIGDTFELVDDHNDMDDVKVPARNVFVDILCKLINAILNLFKKR